MESGLRVPHPTYKRSTRSTTNKERGAILLQEPGEERRQDAPAYTTKCLSLWCLGAVIVSVVVPYLEISCGFPPGSQGLEASLRVGVPSAGRWSDPL